jgi:hypothetical protein
MKSTIAVLLTILFLGANAQMRKERGAVFPLDRELRNGGFMLAPGLTYTFAPKTSGTLIETDSLTTKYEASAKGQLGVFIHLGWFHSFENPSIIHFIDYGASYKLFRGETEETQSILKNGTPQPDAINTYSYSDHNLGLYFNATNALHIGQNTFLSNSIGANLDYIIKEDREFSGSSPTVNPETADELLMQLHYKFGIGFRAFKKLLIVPSIETPILSILPFDNGKSTLNYFNSDYRPILVSIQFYFLRDDPVNCNSPTYNGPDYGM